MDDLERVIKGLEQFKADFKPFCGNGSDWARVDDAINLLKEQEAVKPEVEVMNEIDRLYKCPKCHGYLFYDGQKYCDRCGQEVKWDEDNR